MADGQDHTPEPDENDDEMRSFAWEFGDLDKPGISRRRST